VPLYNLICDVTGINSLFTQEKRIRIDASDSQIDTSRLVKLEFDATINGDLDWEFKPTQRSANVHPGQMMQTTYLLRNNTDQVISTQSIPGVTPWQATEYIKKVECFCFDTQTLQPGEAKEMGLTYVIDPQLPEQYSTVTLSYTIMNLDRDSIVNGGQNDAAKVAKLNK
jgi:cytochrome c oxidase assembly protein subunit 11